MTRRPRWYRLPEDLRRSLERHLAPGESVQRPKREWIASQVIVAEYIFHTEAGVSGWHACSLIARAHELHPWTVSRIVRKSSLIAGDCE
jgi:hypothetical protein